MIIPAFRGEWHAATLGEIYKIRMTEIFGGVAGMEKAYQDHISQPSPRNAWDIADRQTVYEIGKKCTEFLPSERNQLRAIKID